jgi:hypothetical protein
MPSEEFEPAIPQPLGSNIPICISYFILKKSMLITSFSLCIIVNLPFPGAARSKEWLCGRSFAGTEGSNPAGDMDVYLLCVIR